MSEHIDRERLGGPPGSDPISERDRLVGRIVEELRTRGYYLAHFDPHAAQLLIDVRWAAQAAGREIGRRTRTYASVVGKRLPGMVTVVVAPCEPSAAETRPQNEARAVVEELLAVAANVSADRLPA